MRHRLHVLLVFPLLAGLACSAQKDRDAHLAMASEYEAKGELEAAVLELRNALAADPQNARTNFRLAELMRRTGEPGKAVYYYAETRRLDPSYLDAYLQGARLVRRADPAEAARLADAAVELEPSNVGARLLVIRLAIARGDVDAALRTAERLVTIAPEDTEALLGLASALQQRIDARIEEDQPPESHDLERALAAADRAIERAAPKQRWRTLAQRAELLSRWPGREGEAVPVYRAALEAAGEPRSALAVARVALAHARRTGDRELRAWLLERVIEADPSRLHAWVELARMEQDAGGSAEAVYARLLEARPEDPEAHIEWARFLASTGRDEEAMAHLEQAADAGVAPAALLATLADLRFQRGEREEADRIVSRLAREHPDHPATGRALAQQAIGDGRLAEAETSLKAQVGSREDPEALRLLAVALLGQNELAQALAVADQSLELAPGYARAEALRAQIRARTGDWRGVARDLNSVALRARRLKRGERVLLARAYYELGRTEGGARLLEPLVSGDAVYVPAALELARRRSAEDPAGAREILERARRAEPDQPRVLAMLARLELEGGDAAAARELLDAAVKRDPDSPEVRLTRARLLAAQGEVGEAIDDARRAFEAAPEQPDAAYLLVQLLGSQDRVAEAVTLLDAAAEADTLPPSGKLLLARLHASEGHAARARTLLEEIYTRAPDLPGLRNDLAFLLAEEGEQLERARELAEKALEETPDEPEVLHTLGYVYLRAGLYERAAMRLQEAVDRASKAHRERADHYYHLGLALRQVRRNESAADAFERALELDPDLPQAGNARRERRAALLGDPAPKDPFEGS